MTKAGTTYPPRGSGSAGLRPVKATAVRPRASTSVARRYILGLRVDATSYPDAASRVMTWARRGESRYVCVANVHMVMESRHSAEFCRVVNGADLVTPDGMPLVCGLQLLGVKEATRVYGPDLTAHLLEIAARQHIPIGFYGGSPEVVTRLLEVLPQRFPGLSVSFGMSPPFRALTPREDQVVVEQINRSGTRILFVGLGCPKQEGWMADHVGRVLAVMVGVGAAFDFLAGAKPQAPRWMQRFGMEWFFRLCTEPRRLWRRYLGYGPQFVWLFARQLLAHKRSGT